MNWSMLYTTVSGMGKIFYFFCCLFVLIHPFNYYQHIYWKIYIESSYWGMLVMVSTNTFDSPSWEISGESWYFLYRTSINLRISFAFYSMDMDANLYNIMTSLKSCCSFSLQQPLSAQYFASVPSVLRVFMST